MNKITNWIFKECQIESDYNHLFRRRFRIIPSKAESAC